MSLLRLVKRLLGDNTRLILGEDGIKYHAMLYYLRKRENLIEVHLVITIDLELHVRVC